MIIKIHVPDFPGGLLVKTLNFHCREYALVQSLVGELRYCMPYHVVKKKERKFVCSKPGEVSVTWYPTVHGDCGSCLRSRAGPWVAPAS